MLASGATMALPQVSMPVLGILTGERGADVPPAQDAGPSTAATAPNVDWPAALASAARRFPDARLRMLYWPSGGEAAYVRLRRPGEWHFNGTTVVWFDRDGRVLQAKDAMLLPAADRAFSMMWSVHASRLGGPLWQVLTCATGLGLATLSALGALGYVRRLKKPSGNTSAQRAPT
jgi:uncharacterized iron-regulated membrane protein